MPEYRYYDSELYGCPIHPKALELAAFPFFWDVCDENAPFGSDEGYHGLVHYWEWDEVNKNSPLENCLLSYLRCIYPEKRASELMEFCFLPYEQYLIESKNHIGSNIIFDIYELDQYIASIGFGSFVKYGEVHYSLKKHLRFAVERMYKPASEFSGNEEKIPESWLLYKNLINLI